MHVPYVESHFVSLFLVHVHVITESTLTWFFVLFFQRQGRSDSYATEFDLEAEEYVPLPKGDVHKKKEVIQDVTLHDLDIANARPQVFYLYKIDMEFKT